MKKYLNYALGYAIAAMVGGVFYRELTKWTGFSGVTALGKVHTHLFVLGMLLFMLVALLSKDGEVEKQKTFRAFLRVYAIGLPLTAAMMVTRGVLQVLAVPLSSGLDAAVSGLSGIGHMLVGAGLILLLTALKRSASPAPSKR